MKVKHIHSAPEAHEVLALNAIAEISNYIQKKCRSRRDSVPTSKEVAEELAEKFEDLIAVPVQILLYSGRFETQHWVNVTSDREYIIDATGDRFNYFTLSKFKGAVTPWIYKRSKLGMYFSNNHLPTDMIENDDMLQSRISGKEADESIDVDILRVTSVPSHRKNRCIYLN